MPFLKTLSGNGLVQEREMNPQLTSLTGKALHYARQSLLPQFEGIDSGDDDLLNRILWFASKGNIPYPTKYAGKVEEDKR